ncbi:MAG: hypothetical protein ACKO34_05045 [Vampirovibrionales bacterium]
MMSMIVSTPLSSVPTTKPADKKPMMAPREEAPVPALPAELANLPAMPVASAGDIVNLAPPSPISEPLPTSPEGAEPPLSPEAAPPSTSPEAKKPLWQDRRVQIGAGVLGLGSVAAFLLTRGNDEEAVKAVEEIKEPVAKVVEDIKEPVATVVEETKKPVRGLLEQSKKFLGGVGPNVAKASLVSAGGAGLGFAALAIPGAAAASAATVFAPIVGAVSLFLATFGGLKFFKK